MKFFKFLLAIILLLQCSRFVKSGTVSFKLIIYQAYNVWIDTINEFQSLENKSLTHKESTVKFTEKSIEMKIDGKEKNVEYTE